MDSDRAATEGVQLHLLIATDAFPNNAFLPVAHYARALLAGPGDPLACAFERTFAAHGWTESWRDTIYDYAHYHSTAHEVLGCFAGHARVELRGGTMVVELKPGDVLVLPAGVAHRKLEASDDFAVVGAYAGGRDYDMRRSSAPEAEQQIARVPLPLKDPVFGPEGPLIAAWRRGSGKQPG